MNKVIVMGRLTADPEIKQTQNGVSYCRFTVAVGRYSKDKQSTDWIDCVAWRGMAEFIGKYFGKGKMILIEGSIQTGSYEDKNGNKRKSVDLLVDKAEFCGEKNSGSSGRDNPVNDFAMVTSDDDLPF